MSLFVAWKADFSLIKPRIVHILIKLINKAKKKFTILSVGVFFSNLALKH